MNARLTLALLFSLALTACGQSGTASFGGYVPPVDTPAPVVRTGQAVVSVTAPQGVTPALALRFPDTSEQAITTSGTHEFSDLTPGLYVLTGTNVRVDGFTFAPQFSGSPLNVTSDTTVTASVQYAPLGGRLAVNVRTPDVRTPDGLTPHVRITGPGSFTRNVTHSGTTLLTDLVAGAYTVTAEVRPYNGQSHTPTIVTDAADVRVGVTRSVGVTYSAPSAALNLTVSGLPDSERARVRLTGPGLDLSLQDSTELSALAPGTYTLIAEPVTTGGGVFTPDQGTQALTLGADQTGDVAVTYR